MCFGVKSGRRNRLSEVLPNHQPTSSPAGNEVTEGGWVSASASCSARVGPWPTSSSGTVTKEAIEVGRAAVRNEPPTPVVHGLWGALEVRSCMRLFCFYREAASQKAGYRVDVTRFSPLQSQIPLQTILINAGLLCTDAQHRSQGFQSFWPSRLYPRAVAKRKPRQQQGLSPFHNSSERSST